MCWLHCPDHENAERQGVSRFFYLCIFNSDFKQSNKTILVVSLINFVDHFYFLTLFRYLERFSVVILQATILMIACQLTLLYFWVKINNLPEDKKNINRKKRQTGNFVFKDVTNQLRDEEGTSDRVGENSRLSPNSTNILLKDVLGTINV